MDYGVLRFFFVVEEMSSKISIQAVWAYSNLLEDESSQIFSLCAPLLQSLFFSFKGVQKLCTSFH